MAQPMPQKASAESEVPLRHPVPDSTELHNPIIGNVEALEHSAANLNGGSRGERNDERYSARSRPIDHPSHVLTSGASRPASFGSLYNAVFDQNTLAKTGVYSPKEPSPLASPKRTDRSRAGSKASLHTNYEALRILESAPASGPQRESFRVESPLLPPSSSHSRVNSHAPESPASHRTEVVEEQYHDNEAPAEAEAEAEARLASFNEEEQDILPDDTSSNHQRSASLASVKTFQPSLFNDFDGVHYSSIMEDPEETDDFDTYANVQRQTWAEPPPRDSMVYYPAPVPKMLNLPQRLSLVSSAGVQDKRRTQVLESMHPAVRQSAIWLPPSVNRDSEYRDDTEVLATDKRTSNRTSKRVSALPAHLRASAFFERPSIPQEMQVKHESAVATLDNFLNASASTPADAFTDHPIVGNVLRDVYSKERRRETARQSTFSALNPDKLDARKSRSMLSGSRLSMQQFGRLGRRSASKPDLGIRRNTIAGRGDDFNDIDGEYSDGEEAPRLSRHVRASSDPAVGNEDDEDEEEVEDDESETEEEEEFLEEDQRNFGPPTTLLAELQMRKAELKGRNRTAVQAFPNGMHATLLELDAVAQIEKKRRRGQRTALAWEDPAAVAAAEQIGGDDEIPLGVLFPPKNRLINRAGGDDWDRPLGLIEKKHREDNEPLSSRRNRLRGISPSKLPVHAAGGPDHAEEDSEHEGETLAERTRRLKTLETLNSALPDKARPPSADFASEIMSQFGVPDQPSNAESTAVEETLGQRRKRLQAEERARQANADSEQPARQAAAEAMQDANTPAATQSIALLTPSDAVSQPKFTGAEGGLLNLSEQHQAQQRQELLKRNMGMRMPSNEIFDKPNAGPAFSGLLGMEDNSRSKHKQNMAAALRQVSSEGQGVPPIASNGLLGLHDQQRDYQREQMMEQSKRNTAFLNVDPSMAQPKQTYAGGRFNDGTGGVIQPVPIQPPPAAYDSLQQSMFYNNMNMRAANINPISPMGHNAGYPSMLQMPQVSHLFPPQGMPMQYEMPVMYPGYYPQMTQQIPPMMMDQAPLDQTQMDAIENWRQSVM